MGVAHRGTGLLPGNVVKASGGSIWEKSKRQNQGFV